MTQTGEAQPDEGKTDQIKGLFIIQCTESAINHQKRHVKQAHGVDIPAHTARSRCPADDLGPVRPTGVLPGPSRGTCAPLSSTWPTAALRGEMGVDPVHVHACEVQVKTTGVDTDGNE